MSTIAKKGRVLQSISTASLFKSPPTKVTSVGNGVRVASQAFDSELATVGVRINTGSRNDVKNGTASLLNRLTKRKLASQIGNSAKITSYTNREHTVYSISSTREDSKNLLALLQDTIANPSFDAQTVEAERAALINEVESKETQYQQNIFQYLHRTAFMDSALGSAPEGTVDGLKSITVADLQAFHNQQVVQRNVVLAAAGPVDHDNLVASANSGLTKLSSAEAPTIIPAVFVGSDIQYRFDSMREAHVALAFETAPANSQEAFTFKLMQSILGSWNNASFGSENRASRLAQELQHTESANSFETFNFAYKDTGLFGVKVAAAPRHLEEALYFITFNLVRLSNDVTGGEVERAKNHLKTQLSLNLADPEHAVNDIGWQLLSYDRRITSAEVASRIDEITVGDVQITAHRFLNDEDHALAAVGPLHGLPDYNWIRRRSYWHRF